MRKIARYRKFVAALVGSGLYALWFVLADNAITPQEWIVVTAMFVGVPGAVFGFANEPEWLEVEELELESVPLLDPDELADAVAARLHGAAPRDTVRRGDPAPDDDPATTDR